MRYFLDKTVTLRRLRRIDANRSAFSATGTSVGYPASLQEPSPEIQQLYEGQIGNLFSCFVDVGVPVVNGDQVVCSSVTYSVRDVKTMDFGSTQYKRLVLTKGD